MTAASNPVPRAGEPTPLPFGRTFWLCVVAATVLAVIGVGVWLALVRQPLQPRYPGWQPAVETLATQRRAAAEL